MTNVLPNPVSPTWHKTMAECLERGAARYEAAPNSVFFFRFGVVEFARYGRDVAARLRELAAIELAKHQG